MKRLLIAIAVIIFSFVSLCHALETDTHEAINERVARNTINGFSLNSYLKDQLGMQGGINEIFNYQYVWQWLREGGKKEDVPYWYMPYVRSFNHFHDPLSDRGFKGIWFSSIIWSQLPVVTQDPGGWYSWHDARFYFYKALTSANKTDRDKYFAETFRGIGQLMHLVEDASVPAHVRDDGHPFGFHYEKWVLANLEKQGLLSLTPITFDKSILNSYVNLSAPVPISNIIDTNQYSLINPNPALTWFTNRIGISEFTNANFFSEDTIFKNFPHPAKENTTAKLVEQTAKDGKLDKVWYIQGYTSERLAAYSYMLKNIMVVYPGIPIPIMEWLYSLDNYVYKDYAKELIPRAVGYSAGLLNYFFRGDIDITRDSNDACKYVIQNLSNEKMSGSFGLYYDDASNNRYNIASWGLTVSAGGQSDPITLNIPDEAKGKSYILIFQGTMGNETGAVVGNANIEPLTSACGTNLTISGLDRIPRNTPQQYTTTGCTGCSDDVTWSVLSGGACIDENGILTISNTACGTVRVKADCQKCNLSNFKDIKAACDSLTITGSDTIDKNSMQQYTAEGCCGNVNWFVIGKGAVIDSNGFLTTDETACGIITVIAVCPDCDTFAIKEVKASCDSSLTISGSDTITKDSTQQYTTSGCCGTVEWSVTGKETSISEEGLLTTDETACGIITVAAKCPDCETSATKDVLADCESSLAISGSDTIRRNSTEQYIAEGCCGQIEWTVSGTGASIDENGLLTTDETACGTITVKADCPDCNLSASKDIKVICDSLTITGSDTTIRNSTKQYTASGCCAEGVVWSVSAGTGSQLGGSTITQAGVLTAGSTSCGSLKVTATCAACGTSATQDVRVTDAGQWVSIAQCRCCFYEPYCCAGEITVIKGKYMFYNDVVYSDTPLTPRPDAPGCENIPPSGCTGCTIYNQVQCSPPSSCPYNTYSSRSQKWEWQCP